MDDELNNQVRALRARQASERHQAAAKALSRAANRSRLRRSLVVATPGDVDAIRRAGAAAPLADRQYAALLLRIDGNGHRSDERPPVETVDLAEIARLGAGCLWIAVGTTLFSALETAGLLLPDPADRLDIHKLLPSGSDDLTALIEVNHWLTLTAPEPAAADAAGTVRWLANLASNLAHEPAAQAVLGGCIRRDGWEDDLPRLVDEQANSLSGNPADDAAAALRAVCGDRSTAS